MPNIVVGLENETIGVTNYDVYISDCVGEYVYVTGITFNDFPYTFNSDSYIIYNDQYCYFISGDTGCICEGSVSYATPTQTPTNTVTPTTTPTSTNTPTITPTNTATVTVTRTSTQTPTLTSSISQTPTNTSTVTATPNVSSTQTPTITPTHTVTPTVTPTSTVLWVTISGCCVENSISTLFDFGNNTVTVGSTFYWAGNQVNPAQCYIVTALNGSIAGTPLATISTVYSSCTDCTTVTQCVTPTPTQTATPTVTPTKTVTATVTPSPSNTPTDGSAVRRCTSCCDSSNSNNFVTIAGNPPIGTVIVGTNEQCYILGSVSTNQQTNIIFSGYMDDCETCILTYPCQSTPTPTPTVTPTPTSVYKWKLTAECCEFGYPESITIYSEANLPGGNSLYQDGSYLILDGVVYQIAGPQQGTASYTPSNIQGYNGIYQSCQEAFDSGFVEPCAPEPTPLPQCECYYGSQITYACSTGQLCPPSIEVSYVDCEDGSSGSTITILQGQSVSLARCVVDGSIQPTSQLLPSQNLDVQYAGICCNEVNLDSYYRVTRCITGEVSVLNGPSNLISGSVVRSTEGYCWIITSPAAAPASYTYLSSHQSCQSCLS